MNQSRVVLSIRDYEILQFLWKWKVATTSMISTKFYGQSLGELAYRRLFKLKKGGFVTLATTRDGAHHFWVLDEEGFAVIKSSLPPLIAEGYRSENLKHDILVVAAHLGDWLTVNSPDVATWSEQELRRVDPQSYPDGINKYAVHRPDGYWLIRNGDTVRAIALEMELTQKQSDAYADIICYYLDDENAEQVVWIVKTRATMKIIQRRIKDVIHDGHNIHSFIMLDDFLLSRWQTKVVSGKDTGKKLSELLCSKPSQPLQNREGEPFFDTRKKPMKSPHKLNLATLTFVD